MVEAGRSSRPGPGDVLGGRYELVESLGSGGMADVFRATDLRLGRTVAVKMFRADVADAVDPQRTNRETHLLGGVNHPAVVGVLDASDDSSPVPYLVMELVEGHDLGGLVTAGPLPPDLVRRIGADVADALALLHSRSVVHRDVKPANVLVLGDTETDRTGVTAKLSDFGIAHIVDGTRITAPDSILGTAAYLSPEQVRGGSVGAPSDVYSLGLVLIECLSGERAFPGPVGEAAVARLAGPPALPENASTGLAELLSRMTTLDPEARPSAAEVADALRGDLAGAMTAPEALSTARIPVFAVPAAASLFEDLAAASEDGSEDGEEHPRREHRLLTAGLGALVLALVAGLGVVLAGPSLTTGLFAVAPVTSLPAGGATVGTPLADTGGPVSSSSAPPPSPTRDPSPHSTPRRVPARAVPAARGGTSASSARSPSPSPSAPRHRSPTPTPTPSPTLTPSPSPTPSLAPTGGPTAPASPTPTPTAASPAPSPSPTANSGTPQTSRTATPQPTPSPSR